MGVWCFRGSGFRVWALTLLGFKVSGFGSLRFFRFEVSGTGFRVRVSGFDLAFRVRGFVVLGFGLSV